MLLYLSNSIAVWTPSLSVFVELVARLAIYALAIPGFPRWNGESQARVTLEILTLFGTTLTNLRVFRPGLLGASTDKVITPQLMDLASRRLIQVSHEVFDVNVLSMWFCVLNYVVEGSVVVNRGLLDRRSIIIQFIWYACSAGGLNSVIAVVDAGILPILWKFSKTEVELKEPLTEGIQKCLQKHLRRKPLAEIDLGDKDSIESPSSLSIWVKFKKRLVSRIELRRLLEQQQVFCSNGYASPKDQAKCSNAVDVISLSTALVVAKNLNGIESIAWSVDLSRMNQSVHGLNRIPNEREMTIMGEIGKVESWYVRDEVLSKDRTTKLAITNRDDLPIFRLDFTRGPEILQRAQLTLREARWTISTVNWDILVYEYKIAKNYGLDVGPLIVGVFPRPGGEQESRERFRPFQFHKIHHHQNLLAVDLRWGLFIDGRVPIFAGYGPLPSFAIPNNSFTKRGPHTRAPPN
ncbi:hypothetical protein D9757_010249 [Collybiopsis confluens]|uniref:Uncharacterized protein n=1 Tax=Collybiopsis confluens TaxID=2823264 RepID=A0A8H5HB61_9AGAR|nr:hypothetical protein D9757_010249 [Collybiopsis confluens]